VIEVRQGALAPADAQQLKRGTGRIAERTQQVEDRRRAELLANRRDVLHRRMHVRREAEADSELVEAALDRGRRSIDVHPQRRQHIGRAALARDAAIAVLGDGHARRRGDDGRGRADVEQVAANAPRAARIDQPGAAGADRGHVLAHGDRRPGDFKGGFPLGVQGRQQDGDLARGNGPRHDLIDDPGHFFQRQVVSGGQTAELRRDHSGGSSKGVRRQGSLYSPCDLRQAALESFAG